MDSSETITVHTHAEDELSFIAHLITDSDVSVIPSQVGLTGPVSLSLNKISEIRDSGSPDARVLLLWNMSCPAPLYWSPFLQWYDAHWEPFTQSEGSRIKPHGSSPWFAGNSKEHFCEMQHSFRQRSIDKRLFAHGMIVRGLSPVIELSLPPDDNGYLSIQANFFKRLSNEVWIRWNRDIKRWEHESTEPEALYNNIREQSTQFIDWQERVFDWVRGHWGKWIIPRFTYRSGLHSITPEIMGQTLADLLGKTVLDVDPQKPTVSPRDDGPPNDADTGELAV